jgi:hypothetical protein
MAEESKYGKALDALKQNQQPAPTGKLKQATVEQRTETKQTVLERVRPRSKRSDPAWRPYTLMLKRETHTEAGIILKRMDTGQDLSDLAQELFEQWVKAHS